MNKDAKNNAIQNHPNYHVDDYAYLKEKGYSDEEILTIWNRDADWGAGPQSHENNPFFNRQ